MKRAGARRRAGLAAGLVVALVGGPAFAEPAPERSAAPEGSAAPAPERSAAPAPERSTAPEAERSAAPEAHSAPSSTAAAPRALRATDPAEFEAAVREYEGGATTGPSGKSLGLQLLQTVLMLGAVVALIYLLLGKLLPRALNLTDVGRRALIATPPRGVIELVDRLVVDPKRGFVVVRVGGEHFLVGLGEHDMSLIAKLDAPPPVEATPVPAPSGFLEALKKKTRAIEATPAPKDPP